MVCLTGSSPLPPFLHLCTQKQFPLQMHIDLLLVVWASKQIRIKKVLNCITIIICLKILSGRYGVRLGVWSWVHSTHQQKDVGFFRGQLKWDSSTPEEVYLYLLNPTRPAAQGVTN